MDTTIVQRDWSLALFMCGIGVVHAIHCLCLSFFSQWRHVPLRILHILYLVTMIALWVTFLVLQQSSTGKLAYALYQLAKLVNAVYITTRLFIADIQIYKSTTKNVTVRHCLGIIATIALLIAGLCCFAFVNQSEWLWVFTSGPVVTLSEPVLKRSWKDSNYRPIALPLLLSVFTALAMLLIGVTIANWILYPGEVAPALYSLCIVGSPNIHRKRLDIEERRVDHELSYLQDQLEIAKGQLGRSASREPLVAEDDPFGIDPGHTA